MKIIRDEELFGLMMIPLLVDWRIRRCNEKGCTSKPNTIITGAGENIPAFGLCELHFQEGNTEGGTEYSLVFDNFDAFKTEEQ
uniref:Uncharacterized protein n=1 Tax=viral metagenome TaxID=1070528 RepID=A0A6M3LTE6_9ZZZZ